MPSLIVDLVLVLAAVLLIIKYTKKGLVKTVLDFCKIVLSIILAFCLRKPLGKALDSWFMNAKVTEWVKASLHATASGEDKVIDFASIYEDIPAFYTNILTKFGLDLENVQENINNLPNLNEMALDTLAENIGASISMMFSIILAVLIVFTISIIVLTIVVHFLDLLTRFKAINFVNKALGFVFGLAIAFLVMWIISAIVGLLIKFVGPIKPEIFNDDMIEKSVVLKFFSNLNLIQIVLDLIGK